MNEELKENEFERLLKEKADRFEMKSSPGVWEDVHAAIQQDRRRRFAWWWMAALLFGALGTGAFFMLENKSHQPSTSSTAENNSDRNSSAAINSSSEKNNSEKNSQTTGADTTLLSQDQIADNTPSLNHDDKVLKNKNKVERYSVPSNPGSESRPIGVMNQDPEKIGTGQHDGNSSSLSEINSMNSKLREFISTLSPKQFSLLLLEETIRILPLPKPSLDFHSPPPPNHSFYFEGDAMTLTSFVWNHTTAIAASSAGTNFSSSLPSDNRSYSFTKGYSAGGNFIREQDNVWLYGIGVHLTKTHLEALTAQQSVSLYDTSYVFDGTAYQMEVAYTGDTIIYQSQHDRTQWFDVSLIMGVKLFPSSKNHVRILTGGGYSRLITDRNSDLITPTTFYAFADSATVSNTVASLGTTPVFSYQKNQLQLFSEISYERDLTSQLSFTAGMQLHYFPMNLLNSTELSQHMMWLGLKGGLIFRF